MSIEVTHIPTKTVVVPGKIIAKNVECGTVIVSAEPFGTAKEEGSHWNIWFGGTVPIRTEWYNVEDMEEVVMQIAEIKAPQP